MTRAAARERLQVMRLFVSGLNTVAIGQYFGLREPDVERLIHTRTCRDMQREIRMLRDILDAIP